MTVKNFDAVIKNISGEPYIENNEPVTVRHIIIKALLAVSAENNPAGEEKAKRYKLAIRLSDGGDQDMSVEELALVKSLVGLPAVGLGPALVGPVYECLDS